MVYEGSTMKKRKSSMRSKHNTARKINQEPFVNKTQDFVETSKINKNPHKNVKKLTKWGEIQRGAITVN